MLYYSRLENTDSTPLPHDAWNAPEIAPVGGAGHRDSNAGTAPNGAGRTSMAIAILDHQLLRWADETRWTSSIDRMLGTPIAQQVLAGGDLATRAIMGRLVR